MHVRHGSLDNRTCARHGLAKLCCTNFNPSSRKDRRRALCDCRHAAINSAMGLTSEMRFALHTPWLQIMAERGLKIRWTSPMLFKLKSRQKESSQMSGADPGFRWCSRPKLQPSKLCRPPMRWLLPQLAMLRGLQPSNGMVYLKIVVFGALAKR
jgi:hypothetical protein